MVFQVNKKGVRDSVNGMRRQGVTDVEIGEYARGIQGHEPEIAAVMLEYLEEARLSALQQTDG